MSIAAAFAELKAEIENGADPAPALIAEIAAAEGVHPALLGRRWAESGLTAEGVRAAARAADPRARAARLDEEAREVEQANRQFIASLRDFFVENPQHVPALIELTKGR